jgi:Zn-dependent protease
MEPITLALIVFELVVMVLSISLHDCAQAWMANRLGDPTARMMGRISMNPAKHFDTFGMAIAPALALFIFHSNLPYGWGKPVPMTYRNFPRKNGEMLSVLAGPIAQFLSALVALILLVVFKHTLAGADASLGVVVQLALAHVAPIDGLAGVPSVFPLLLFLYFGIVLNLFLCVFNLLPMPFLDGGKILIHFLPYNAAQAFERYSFYFMIAFFLIGGFLVSLVFSPLLAIFTTLLGNL